MSNTNKNPVIPSSLLSATHTANSKVSNMVAYKDISVSGKASSNIATDNISNSAASSKDNIYPRDLTKSFNISFWNIEGVSRNKLSIEFFFSSHVQILCLSELNGSNSLLSLILSGNAHIGYCASDETENNKVRAAILWE